MSINKIALYFNKKIDCQKCSKHFHEYFIYGPYNHKNNGKTISKSQKVKLRTHGEKMSDNNNTGENDLFLVFFLINISYSYILTPG